MERKLAAMQLIRSKLSPNEAIVPQCQKVAFKEQQQI